MTNTRANGHDGAKLSLGEALAVAVRMHQAGDLDAAEALYGRILEAAPAQPDALHFLGMLNNQRGRNERAIELIRRSIAIEPALAASHNNLGNALVEQGLITEAIAAYQEALRLALDWADAHANLGVVLRSQDKVEEAEAAYRRAIEIEPRHIGAHQNLGRLLVGRGEKEEGIAYFCKAITFEPHNPQNWKKLGVAYTVIGRLEDAADIYRQWLARSPDDPIARHLLAACTGEKVPERADDTFIEKTFNSFAKSFDARLEQLGYRAPQLVAGALARALGNATAKSGLDAGCGTGLCGPLIRSKIESLTGVDLSERMIEHAAARQVYDELVRAELTAYLDEHKRAFDVIISADTLVYFGVLDAVVGAAARALRPDGLLIFTLEDAQGDGDAAGHLIRPHGRYAHDRSYVEAVLAGAGLDVVAIEPEILRKEAGKPVAGLLVTAKCPTPGDA